MDYKEIILNKLLDKYEASKSYLKEVNRRIILNTDKIKEYQVENYEQKLLFHEVVEELYKLKIIGRNWLKFEKGNILDEIWLIKENVEKAYIEINRKNPKQVYSNILAELEDIEFNQKWLQDFKKEMEEYLNSTQKENTFLPKAKSKEILRALQEIDDMQCSEGTNSVLKRVFSIKCYKNSKFFEKEIEKNLVRIIKKYYHVNEKNDFDFSTLSDDEILAEIGIVKYPEIIEFCGNMKCKINNQELTFLDSTVGSYINSYTIANIDDIELKNVRKIIFIENKTNYIYYINNKKCDEFVIYHGGVYSPVKGEFFKKIYRASKEFAIDIKYYHWSDIDIGGFNIFTRLRDNIVPELIPYKMDMNTLLNNKNKWQFFDEKYKQKLQGLHELEKYSCFFEVIDFMLQFGIRMEQESLLE